MVKWFTYSEASSSDFAPRAVTQESGNLTAATNTLVNNIMQTTEHKQIQVALCDMYVQDHQTLLASSCARSQLAWQVGDSSLGLGSPHPLCAILTRRRNKQQRTRRGEILTEPMNLGHGMRPPVVCSE